MCSNYNSETVAVVPMCVPELLVLGQAITLFFSGQILQVVQLLRYEYECSILQGGTKIWNE